MNRGAFRYVGLGFAVLVASAAGCSEETEEDGTGGSVTTQTGTGGGTTQTGTGGGTTQTGTGGGTTQTGTGGGTTQTGTGGGGGGGGQSACVHDTSGCTSATCGDNTAEGFEWCDGTDLGQAADCTELGLGFSGGTLVCDGCNYDTSGCTSPTCGDNTAEGGEPCDGTDLGSYTDCTDYGYTAGTIACNGDCNNADLTGCTGGPAGWTCDASYYDASDGCDCGCGIVDPDCADATVASCEWCGLAGSCSPAGAGCPGTVNAADNSQCSGAGSGTCGNNTVEPGETCDGTDLDGLDCTTLGAQFVSGTLACNANCQFLDVSACVVGDPVCGNDIAEVFESCDGSDMGGLTATCVDAGFTGGTITCTDCQLDLTTCTGGTPGWTCPENFYGDGDCDCGCGVVDTDCADATSASCDYCNDAGSCGGFDDCGTPGSTINAADNSTCDAATCGNDIAQAVEICDGADLRELTCEDLEQGFVGGTLACGN